MAYTFMDDYGDEWAISTANPFFAHHWLVEDYDESYDDHDDSTGKCQYVDEDGDIFMCVYGRDRALVWSEIMAKSDAETEKSCYWQFDQTSHKIAMKYREMLPWEHDADSPEYEAKFKAWEKYKDAAWIEFYENYPEHPESQGYLRRWKDFSNA